MEYIITTLVIFRLKIIPQFYKIISDVTIYYLLKEYDYTLEQYYLQKMYYYYYLIVVLCIIFS